MLYIICLLDLGTDKVLEFHAVIMTNDVKADGNLNF